MSPFAANYHPEGIGFELRHLRPAARLLGFNHDVLTRNPEGAIVLKRIQALANVVAGPSQGTLTVVGGSDPRRLIGPGTYPIVALTIFPIWARVTLGGPPPW